MINFLYFYHKPQNNVFRIDAILTDKDPFYDNQKENDLYLLR